MAIQKSIVHGTSSSTLSDVLERVLDKGVVIAGDIKIKLVDIELLTIQVRLVICSVERAMEMGMDWWVTDRNLSSLAGRTYDEQSSRQLEAPRNQAADAEAFRAMSERLERLEAAIARLGS